jgi:hypothetical protein
VEDKVGQRLFAWSPTYVIVARNIQPDIQFWEIRTEHQNDTCTHGHANGHLLVEIPPAHAYQWRQSDHEEVRRRLRLGNKQSRNNPQRRLLLHYARFRYTTLCQLHDITAPRMLDSVAMWMNDLSTLRGNHDDRTFSIPLQTSDRRWKQYSRNIVAYRLYGLVSKTTVNRHTFCPRYINSVCPVSRRLKERAI